MTKLLDLDENLLLQATKITGIENTNDLMRMVLNEFISMKTEEALEDIHDAKIADEAYEEYVRDGCKSRPMREFFEEIGIR